MALDSITLSYLIKELHPILVGTRIDKIQQPEKDEIHLLVRSAGQTQRLLLNAGSTAARIHLTEQAKKNPAFPPMFCMILRKHLEGGKIMDIFQSGLERVVTLIIQNYNERGDLQNYFLHLEIMGKHSNLILVDSETNIILDGIRRYSHLVSRYREVLPGRTYITPPPQNKAEALKDENRFMSLILTYALERKVTKALLDLFNGISPELAKEIVIRAGLETDAILDDCGEIDLSRLYQAYTLFIPAKELDLINPGLYYPPGPKKLPSAFTFIPYEQYADLIWHPTTSLNQAVNLYYRQKDDYNRSEAQRASLLKIVQDHIKRLYRKCEMYENTMAKAQKDLSYQKYGELLTANLYKLTPGLTEITVEDYTDPDYKPITIPLDPSLKGIDNAQHYYKIYNKAKAAIKKTEPFKQAALEEINYLQSIIYSIEQAANDNELKEIHQELTEQAYISGKQAKYQKYGKQATKKKASKHSAKEKEQIYSQPYRFLSSTGKTIIVGRNNKQNDRLTWRQAKPGDLWLHVKSIPGSHVIVPLNENEEFPDDQTLLEAATLAVYFSQARASSQVAVDYTHVRQIKKPRGAKPGMVVYEQYWSLYITPQQETIERLLNNPLQ
ncbi:MAG: fibronectin/fibrinogen-binding protein [Peptococcaceae bacterium]|jgi:predicted ribosome quality control (RQC) complex YloA/Tae2 family protein|nr:fibronectin/fibrinogen-binding protein [Peptococcaceae bacterium]